MVFHAVGSFALLISSSLIADDATDHHDVADNTILKGWCEVNNVCALYDAATVSMTRYITVLCSKVLLISNFQEAMFPVWSSSKAYYLVH